MPKKLALIFALLSGVVAPQAALAQPHTYVERKVEGAELRYIGDIPLALVSGTPEEIGRQHALLVADAARDAMDYPKKFMAEHGFEALWPFIAQAGRTLMLNSPAAYREEVASMAKQSGMSDDGFAVANTLLELRRMGCSAIIAEPCKSATGGPLFARNFDFPTLDELHKYSLVTVYRPGGKHAFASVGFPGLVGVLSGMNDAGLAVATLDVEASGDGSRKFNPKGTPLALVFRRILEECTTVDEAERLLKSETPTTWMNLTVCDRDGGAVFEITPDNIGRRDDEQGFVRCTNHFRTEGLTVGEKCWRYDSLMKTDDRSGPLDIEAIHQALDDANQERLTFQTMIFEPRDLVLHVAFGEPPSSDDPLTRIELAPLFKK